jgi:SAM-dependent methyltransferase
VNIAYVLEGLARHRMPDTWFDKLMEWRGWRSPAETDPDVCWRELRERLLTISFSVEGKHILEIGSGRYARLALWMLTAGASRVTLIDLYATPLHEARHRALLARDCAGLGLDLEPTLARIEVITGDITATPVPAPADRVDAVVSSQALEHMRDPRSVFVCCREWLKPGGVTAHAIDLRDHAHGFRYPLEMLTFSDETWRRWFDIGGGFHVNRWRIADFTRALSKAGFSDVHYEVVERDEEEVRRVMPRLDARFRGISPDLLAVLKADLYGRNCEFESSESAGS